LQPRGHRSWRIFLMSPSEATPYMGRRERGQIVLTKLSILLTADRNPTPPLCPPQRREPSASASGFIFPATARVCSPPPISLCPAPKPGRQVSFVFFPMKISPSLASHDRPSCFSGWTYSPLGPRNSSSDFFPFRELLHTPPRAIGAGMLFLFAFLNKKISFQG